MVVVFLKLGCYAKTDDELGIIDFHARPASDCISIQDRNMFRLLHLIKNAKLSDF